MIKEEDLVELSFYDPPLDIERQIKSLLSEEEVVKFIPGDKTRGVLSKVKIIGTSAEDYVGIIIDSLRDKNVRIASLNVGMPTLEDVFIKLTGSKLSEEKFYR
jgi:hypothetical protein